MKALGGEEDEGYFEEISTHFAYGGASEGALFRRCIGALDGLAIKLKRPTLSKSLRDPGAYYYCRIGGFHAVNVQGSICDHRKKLQLVSSKHIGSCHDSTAFFTSTVLYRLLQTKKDFLSRYGYFIAADSAYCMESFFLLVPFNSPNMRTSQGQTEDVYNFYHSNSRIKIECTFGEMIMRWGIFWRKLQMDLSFVGDIISVAGLLYNFIVDERGDGKYMDYFSSFSHNSLLSESDDNLSGGGDTPRAMISGNNKPKPPGRPTTKDKKESRDQGRDIRRTIAWTLKSRGLTRPSQPGFKYNSYGMVYMAEY